MTLLDILTPEELIKVSTIKECYPNHEQAQRICDEVITPVIDRISKALGQEMDAKFVSYLILNTINS